VKEQATLQHPSEATDRQIDALVYELYGRQQMRADKRMQAVAIRYAQWLEKRRE